jgi:hypothetical protein
MILYLLRDSEATGGYLAAQELLPVEGEERPSILEVRRVDAFPPELWADTLAGRLPVDEDLSNDSTWMQWWPAATVLWVRNHPDLERK